MSEKITVEDKAKQFMEVDNVLAGNAMAANRGEQTSHQDLEEIRKRDFSEREPEGMFVGRAISGYRTAARTAEYAREANRQAANWHKQDNQEEYEKVAIQDANNAGHDVDLGGEHYPAQPQEETEEK